MAPGRERPSAVRTHHRLSYEPTANLVTKSASPGQAPSGTRRSASTSTCKTHRRKVVRGKEAAGRAGRAGEGGRPLVAAGGRPRTFTAVPQPDRPRATGLSASIWKFVASGLHGSLFCVSDAEFCSETEGNRGKQFCVSKFCVTASQNRECGTALRKRDRPHRGAKHRSPTKTADSSAV